MKLKPFLLLSIFLICIDYCFSQNSITNDKYKQFYYWTITKNISSKKIDSDSAYIKGYTTEYSKKAKNITLEFINTFNGEKYYALSNDDGKFEIALEDGEYELYVEGGELGEFTESTTQIALLTFNYGEIRKLDINLDSMERWSEERREKNKKSKIATF